MSVLLVILTLLPLMAMAAMTGCETSPDETRANWQARIDRLERTHGEVAEQIGGIQLTLAQLADALEDAPDDDTVAQEIAEKAATATDVLSALLRHRDTLTEEIARAQARLDSIPEGASTAEINAGMIGQGVASVGTVLPPPWNAVVIAVGTLIGSAGGLLGIIGRRKAKQAQDDADEAKEILESTVAAIENAKRVNETLREGFSEASGLIRSNLSNAAEVRVNEIRTIYGKAA